MEPALGKLGEKIEHLSSYAHVVHTTAKQVISRRTKNEKVFEMSKMKNTRAKPVQLMFFIVKYANLWGFCCRCRCGGLSFLVYGSTRTVFRSGVYEKTTTTETLGITDMIG